MLLPIGLCCSMTYACARCQAAQKAPSEQLEQTASEAVRTGEGFVADLAAAKRSLDDQGVRWGELVGYGLLSACTLAFAFQVTMMCCCLPALANSAMHPNHAFSSGCSCTVAAWDQ